MLTIPGTIPIRIYPLFWGLILMIGWMNSGTMIGTVIWAIVILISVLVHEFGHALTAKFFGQRTEISLVGMGGLTTRQGPSISRWKEFLIVLNGPLVGLLLFFLLYIFNPTTQINSYLRYAINVGVEVNLFWTILNLLPIWPLDGGHLLRIMMESVFGIRGIRAALMLSIIFAAVVGALFMALQQLLMGAVFFMLGFESYRAWVEMKGMNAQDTDSELQKQLQEAQKDLQLGKKEEALSKFLALKEQVKSGVIFVTANQLSARILAEQGQIKQAYELLRPVQNQLSIEYLRFFQGLAFRLEEWEEAARIGIKAYQIEPSSEVAVVNALAYAVMGRASPAIGWLRCAAQQGYPNLQMVIQKREFDAIRQTPEFQAWLKTV